ncbi:cardiolipin synthase [Lutimonas saemankumensis]|uniref:cardiolipin synthase n=1 Tax=Lutimonas saemankumensis TaxID=483016 RepID=UPI001CD2D671|nr:cardiolipin synthase [Lutimonas saemankumensis]MCA0932995.1 cardiolipin synthase [Lutimonas saemankumensis]
MDYIETIRPFALIVYYVFISFVIILIILDNKKPEKAFAFIFLILLVPVAGVIIYLLFGAQYQKRKLFTKKRYFDKVYLQKINQASKEIVKTNPSFDYKKLPVLFYNIEQVSFTYNNEISVLNNGEEKFPVLKEELLKAKQSIHLDYYIIKDDDIGNEVFNILCSKARQGVQVKLIYDDVGSSISKNGLNRLKLSGVRVYPYMPVLFSRLAHKANYRNHRKIVVIDNETGFLGGINIKDKYINPNNYDLFWRDTHLMIKGEAVIDLQYLFISDWFFVSGEKIDLKEVEFKNRHKISNEIPTSILGSDYGKNNQTIKEAFFGMITSAREEILITTPYFIPDDSIFNALKITAKSGVSIKLIIPEKPDIRTAFFASQTYLKDLLLSGVEVYFYTKGMMHSKTMIVDSKISTVGSTNMDQRSFSLNAEVNAFIYNEVLAKKLRFHFGEDLKDCYKLQMKDLRNRPWYIKVLCSIARLIAPIL